MKLTWIGHACFKVEKDGYTLIFDPYRTGSVPGLLPVDEKAHEVVCSHEHGDHFGMEEVTLLENEEKCPFTLETIDTFHDEVKGAKRGPNRITILSHGSEKLVHLGDLGCDLTEEQMEKLRGADVLLIPVGGFYTIDGVQAAKLARDLNPKLIIPMHYRNDELGFGYKEISTVEPFAEEMDSVMEISISELETTREIPAQVVVLVPERAVK